MNRRSRYLAGIVIVALALLLPSILLAQDGTTLQSLAQYVKSINNRLIIVEDAKWKHATRLDMLDERIAALEAKATDTPTPRKPTPNATATSQAFSATVVARQTVAAQVRANSTATASARATERAPVVATTRARVTATAQAARSHAVATRRARDRATPTPDFRSAYRDEVNLILMGDGKGYDVASALFTIGNAFNKASVDPTLILDNAWRIEVTLAVAVLRKNYDDAGKLTPPANLRSFHNLMVEGLSYCNLAADQIVKGIDELDADAIEDALGLIELCTGMLQRAAADPNW